MKWIILTIAAILTQAPHTYWAIDRFSNIEIKWIKISQNVIFCLILSLATLFYVLDGDHWFAAGFALMEIVINVYYYQTEEKDLRKKQTKKWLRWVFAITFPAMIFFFSLKIEEANKEKQPRVNNTTISE